MSKIPYWLGSTQHPLDGTHDPNKSFDPDGDAAAGILAELFGQPAGYINPVYIDLIDRNYPWIIKVEINGVEYDASSIVDFEIDNGVTSMEEFELGTTDISKLTLRLRTNDVIPPNAQVIPYLAISAESLRWVDADITWEDAKFSWEGGHTEWMPLGVFYVDRRERQSNMLVLECLDGLVYADIAYISQLTYPTTMQAVWDEVCAQAGLDYDATVQINPAYTVPAAPTGYTCRQVMSFIAGAHGASVKMSRIGEVSWRTYRADEAPVHELAENDYYRVKQTNPAKTYTRVVVIYDEDDQLTYEAGIGSEDQTLYLVNPLMTQSMVDALHAQISGLSYVPIEMDARGFPHMEHGDRVVYRHKETMTWDEADVAWEDADMVWGGMQAYESLILRQRFRFKGGLAMSLDAPSKSEQASEFEVEGALTEAVNRLNRNAVRYGKPYYGVTHSKEEGIVVQRSDGLAKAVFNSDVLAFYKNSDPVLYFDAVNEVWKFSGTLEGADGVFSGKLEAGEIIGSTIQGGSITGASISGGSINGVAINGGLITGATIQTNATGVYPRVEISNTGNSITVQGGPNQIMEIFSSGTIPMIRFTDGVSQAAWMSLASNMFTIAAYNLINIGSSNNAPVLLNGVDIISALNGKANAFNGWTGSIVVGDGAGGMIRLYFNNGVFQTTGPV